METPVTGAIDKFDSLADLITLGGEALKGIFSDISNGITITDEHSRIIYVNSAFTSITGYQEHDVIGDNPGMLHSGRHDKTFYQKMWEELQLVGRWQGEIWNRRKNGELIPELLTITKIVNNQHKKYYIGIFSDISNIIEENDKKINLALHDPLTGLCNRSLLEDRFDVVFNEYKRNNAVYQVKKEEVALLFIDLNRFKQLNDTYGHLVGDKALLFVANVLASCSRSVDSVARFGGDEFVVMMPNIHAKSDIEAYCGRVHAAMEPGIKVDELLIKPVISIGCCFFPSQAENFDTLITNADEAMYDAKSNQEFLIFYNNH